MINQMIVEYRSIKKEIAELKDRIEQIRYAAMHPTSSPITDMPRAPGYSQDGLAKVYIQIEELEEFYLEKCVQLNRLCIEIEKEIDSLESIERRIIRFRYIDGLSWKKISKLVGYSVSQLHRIHNKIIER